jgi:hypothetical protein
MKMNPKSLPALIPRKASRRSPRKKGHEST